MFPHLRCAAATLSLALLTSLAQAATTYYVATTGTNSNPGTAVAPFGTIQYGIDVASPGDTVLVADGTYSEHDIDFEGKDITVQAQSTNLFAALIDAGLAGPAFLFVNGETSAAKLSGFAIAEGVTSTNYPSTLVGSGSAGGGIRIVDSSPTITGCLLEYCFGWDVQFAGPGPSLGGGIAVSGGSPRVANCVFVFDIADVGGAIWSETNVVTGTAADLTVINSLFIANDAFAGADVLSLVGNVNLINCTFGGDYGYFGVTNNGTVYSYGSTILLANSILWDVIGAGIPPSLINDTNFPGTITVQNSDVEGSGGSGSWGLAGIIDGGNNLDADPLLDVGLLAPTNGSPCINTGDNAVYNTYASDITTDFFGDPRIVGGTIDMGWLESPSACGTPVPTITGPASGAVFAVGAPVTLTGSFTGTNSPHTATWTIGTNVVAGTVDEGAQTVTNTVTFGLPGVYAVQLSVTNACGNGATTDTVGGLPALVVIYDPSAGFVTGGGWIDSPAGAYAADQTLTGKATFGFVSRYQKGQSVPTGDTQFQFRAAGLNFHSTSYQWLVVGGARAQFKGDGTINGVAGYSFILTAVDGQVNGGGGTDKFRVKIWETASGTMVYDNQMGADDSATPSTVLGGGSIVIHN
jgi:hypothetical protein